MVVSMLSACSTMPPIPPSKLETRPGARTVPYTLSAAGHIILDVSINGHPETPIIIDTGANISAIYGNNAPGLNVTPSERLFSVTGLVSSGQRPIAEDVTFKIGEDIHELSEVIVLDRLSRENEAVGLLGIDVLSDYVIQFDRETFIATFIQGEALSPKHFSGWLEIPLFNQVKDYPNKGLYFAELELRGRNSPVLIDTGSEINIVNWPLAERDPEMRELKRKVRDKVGFEGAIGSFPLRMRTVFYDVELGNKVWPKVPVILMDFDSLSNIAPTDKPLMISGASMFTASTFAFDFGRNKIFIRPSKLKKAPQK